MGSSIPLPALQIRPPEQPNVAQQYGQMLSLRSLLGQQQLQQQQIQAGQQENQLRAAQIQDIQTAKQLAQDPKYIKRDASGTPTGYDYDRYSTDLSASGVGPDMLSKIQTLRKNAADTFLAQQQGQSKAIENHQAINKQAWEKLEDFKAITDPAQRQATWQQLGEWAKTNFPDIQNMPAQAPTNDAIPAIEAGLAMRCTRKR